MLKEEEISIDNFRLASFMKKDENSTELDKN